MERNQIPVDLALSLSSHFIAKLTSYIVVTILARYLTKENMGIYFFAVTLSTFFVLFTDLGTNIYLNRKVSEKPSDGLVNLSEVISLRILLFVIFLIFICLFTQIVKPEILTVVILTSIFILLENFYYSFSAFFLGLRNVKVYANTLVSSKLLLVILVIIAVKLNASFIQILFCIILANTFLILFSIYQVSRISGRILLSWDLEVETNIIRLSFPFFLITLLTMLQFNIDTLMLGFMLPFVDVAAYTAGFKILEVSQFVIRPLIAVYFPLSARLAVQGDWKKFKTLFQRLLFGTCLLGLFIMTGIIVNAEFVMQLVFGSKYVSSADILQIMFLCAPFIYMWVISFSFASALHIEVKVIRIMVIGVTIHVILNLLGIYSHGITGTAWAMVISQMFMTIWLIFLTWQQLKYRKQLLYTGPQLEETLF